MSSIKRNSSSMNKLLKTLDSPSITNTVENDIAQSQGQGQVLGSGLELPRLELPKPKRPRPRP